MIRRKDASARPILSDSGKRFDACEHKKVAINRIGSRNVAKVDCPRTVTNGGPIESDNFYGYQPALSEVRGRVADILCQNCHFYNMPPNELLQEQVLGAQLQADLARALAIQGLQQATGILDWGQLQPEQAAIPPTKVRGF